MAAPYTPGGVPRWHNVALGLHDDLQRYAQWAGSVPWEMWSETHTSRDVEGKFGGNFGKAFTQVMSRAPEIKFNLNGIMPECPRQNDDDSEVGADNAEGPLQQAQRKALKDTFDRGKNGFAYGGVHVDGYRIIHNATNTEFNLILTTEQFRDKTTFHFQGVVVDTTVVFQAATGE